MLNPDGSVMADAIENDKLSDMQSGKNRLASLDHTQDRTVS